MMLATTMITMASTVSKRFPALKGGVAPSPRRLLVAGLHSRASSSQGSRDACSGWQVKAICVLDLQGSRLRTWLMQQKVVKLKKDGNKAAKGGNWPVFDFCNQFLQVLIAWS